jgi:serine/threonine protein kinase
MSTLSAHCQQCKSQLSANGVCHRCLFEAASVANSAATWDAADSPSIEDLKEAFPQWEILRLVGRGGMGSIYHARQTSLDRDIAIKIIDRRFSNEPEFLDRFEREARALAKLSHPNVVAVYDFGRSENGLVYLTMEYVHGLNLREAMASMSIEPSETLEILKRLCSAIHYAHSKGVVHRDIKPENILLAEDGSIKIADFGIAKILDPRAVYRQTATQHVLGTMHYLAPEQLESRGEVDHRVDIYALGVVFYELLTRELPIGSFESPSQLNPAIHAQWRDTMDAVVMKALTRRPSARYQSAEELKSAIEQVEATWSSTSVPTTSPEIRSEFEPASVPFEREDLGGLVDVLGFLHVSETGLQFEYRLRDGLFGKIKSKVQKVEIPWARVLRTQWKPGVFKSKFIVTCDSIAAFQDFPGSEEGRIEVGIKRANAGVANRLIERIRAYAPRVVSQPATIASENNIPNPTLAVGLILFAIFNAGILAIAQVSLAYHTSDWIHVVSAVAVAVTLGPVVLVQLISGIVYGGTGVRGAANVGAVVSMLPVSPLVIVGIPFGVWVLRNFNDGGFGSDRRSANPQASMRSSQGWGLTTTFFVRDSRYARWMSLLESSATSLAVIAFLLYVFGAYPARLHYRLVGEQDSANIDKVIRARLMGVPNLEIRYSPPNQVEIQCWRYQTEKILAKLRMAQAPTLTCIFKQDAAPESATASYMPILGKLATNEYVARSFPGGQEVQTAVGAFLLDGDAVSQVTISRRRELEIVLSKTGWERYQKLMESMPPQIGFGLVVDGWVQGIAGLDQVQDRRLVFQCGGDSKWTTDSIQAAIRGPNLQADMELVE